MTAEGAPLLRTTAPGNPAPAFQADRVPGRRLCRSYLFVAENKERGTVQVLVFRSSRTACSRSTALSFRAAGFPSNTGEVFR